MFWNTIQAGTVNAGIQRLVVALGERGYAILLHMVAYPEFAEMIAHRAREYAGIVTEPFLGRGIPAANKELLGFWSECPSETAGAAILRFLVALEGDAEVVLEKMKKDPFFISRLAGCAKTVADTGTSPKPEKKNVSLGVDVYTYFLRRNPVTK
jgi:hypothetical protein